MGEKVRLEAITGPLQGNGPFEFDQADIFIFGRANDCHARLPGDDRTASRHHFMLAIQPPRGCIRDIGSRNGTFVNGRKIGSREPGETPEQGAQRQFEDVELRDGDEIRAGATTFRLTVEQPEPAAPPRQAPAAAAAGSSDPLEALVHALAERRGLPPQRPGEAPEIPGYQLGRELGRGGMGVVYLARRLGDGRQVAIKVMLAEREADERARKMFEREVQVQLRLRGHPHCVPLLAADLEGYSSYFVMDYCPGGSIDRLMGRRRGRRLSLAEAGPLILDALDGLAYAHRHGIVHRDLKPSNILLGRPEAGPAKLTDFGLARDFEQAGITGLSNTGDYGGNPLGMPREQILDYKHVRPVSDVWGIAATFYNMLTGAAVRNFGSGVDPIAVILAQPPVPIRQRDPSIPRQLAAVIDRALRDDLAERYQTAREFREALREVL
jgi:hypothetical protein